MSFDINKDLKDKIPSFTGTIKDAANKTSKLASDVADQIDGIKTNVANAFDSSLKALTSGLPTSNKVFGGGSDKDKPLMDNSNKGTVETDSKLNSISSTSSSAIANPVSFVSKPVDESVSGVDSSKLAGNTTEEPVDDEVLEKAAEANGEEVEDSTSLADTIKSVSKDVADGIHQARETVDATIDDAKSTVHDVVSGIKEGISGVTDNAAFKEIKDTINTVKDVGGAIWDAGQEIGGAILDVLPGPLREYVSGASDDFVNKIANKLMGDRAQSMINIVSQLGKLGYTDGVLDIFEQLGGNYCSVKDSSGSCLGNMYGDHSKSTIDGIYHVANSICNNIGVDGLIDYRYNKDLYDVLMGLASDLGISDLIDQLKACGRGENTYFDSRTADLLKNMAKPAAVKGDSSTYASIQKAVGPSNMTDAKMDTLTLIANSKYKDAETTVEKLSTRSSKKNIDSIMEAYSLTSDDLLKSNDIGVTALDANHVIFATSTDTNFVDTALGRDTRRLVQSLAILS